VGDIAFTLPYRERVRLHGRAYRAQQNGHREVGGALLASARGQLRLVFIKNTADRPYRYEMAWGALRRVKAVLMGKGERLMGTFHSHPLGMAKLSRGDRVACSLRASMLVYDVCGREAALWRVAKRGARRVAYRVPLKVAPRRPTKG